MRIVGISFILISPAATLSVWRAQTVALEIRGVERRKVASQGVAGSLTVHAHSSPISVRLGKAL